MEAENKLQKFLIYKIVVPFSLTGWLISMGFLIWQIVSMVFFPAKTIILYQENWECAETATQKYSTLSGKIIVRRTREICINYKWKAPK